MELEELSVVEKAAMLSGGSEWDSRCNDRFLIFNYDTQGNGLGGFLTFLLAEALAQVVNFFVQMKWVFKSDSSFKDAAWKYVILAVIVSYPLLKFWVMPKSKDSKEATK